MRTIMLAAAALAVGLSAAPAAAQEEQRLGREQVRDILRQQGYSDIGDIRQYFTARAQDEQGERVNVLIDGRTGLVRDAESGRLTEQAAVKILEERGLQNVEEVRWREDDESYRMQAQRNGEDIVVEVHGFTGQVRQVSQQEASGEPNAGRGEAEVPGGIGRTEDAFD